MSEVDSTEPKPLVPLVPLASPTDDLDVKIAAELLERARVEGVSLVGQGGLLAQVTRAVLQAALEAEMADHLGYTATCGTGTGNCSMRLIARHFPDKRELLMAGQRR